MYAFDGLISSIRRHFFSLSGIGITLGTLFFAAALTPTLVPRTALTQGALAGACFAIGYGAGVLFRWVWRYLESLVADDGPIRELHVFDLRESMRNGGGPACLRLRVVLTEQERRATHAGLWIDDARYAALTDWVKRHYRDRLAVSDLADPALLDECRTALDDLTRLLGLGADLYPFQRNA